MKDSDERSYHAWIVLAMFSPLLSITYPLYLKDDRTPRFVQDSNERQANVELAQDLYAEISSDLKRRDIKYFWALQNLEKEEELLVDYRSSYHFRSVPRDEAQENLRGSNNK